MREVWSGNLSGSGLWDRLTEWYPLTQPNHLAESFCWENLHLGVLCWLEGNEPLWPEVQKDWVGSQVEWVQESEVEES